MWERGPNECRILSHCVASTGPSVTRNGTGRVRVIALRSGSAWAAFGSFGGGGAAQWAAVNWAAVIVVVLMAPGLVLVVAVVCYLGIGGRSDEESR